MNRYISNDKICQWMSSMSINVNMAVRDSVSSNCIFWHSFQIVQIEHLVHLVHQVALVNISKADSIHLEPETTDRIEGWGEVPTSNVNICRRTNKEDKLTDYDQDHAEQLDSWSQQRAEDHGILRRPEDVTVDILPSRLFHCVFLVREEKKLVFFSFNDIIFFQTAKIILK